MARGIKAADASENEREGGLDTPNGRARVALTPGLRQQIRERYPDLSFEAAVRALLRQALVH